MTDLFRKRLVPIQFLLLLIRAEAVMNIGPLFCGETTILINLELSSFGDRIYGLTCRLKSFLLVILRENSSSRRYLHQVERNNK